MLTLPSENRTAADSMRVLIVRTSPARNGDKMGVLTYIVLTLAVFALLGLAQKLVERL